ncbi:MAG: hypothetical protein DCC74_11065 [Proteobacteria bacterium]|nr:MAG: hypothetical protein DCC74_11065 [Pseudomonadota bacterium]
MSPAPHSLLTSPGRTTPTRRDDRADLPLSGGGEKDAAPALTSPDKGEVGPRKRIGRGSASQFARTRAMTAKARSLRHVPTDAELALWKALRRKQLLGIAFRRQHPVGNYVLDFYCPSHRIAIEIDGGQHASEQNRQKDATRSRWLSGQGIEVLRFWNSDVLSNLAGVLDSIASAISRTTPTRRDDRADLPLSGGGERGDR